MKWGAVFPFVLLIGCSGSEGGPSDGQLPGEIKRSDSPSMSAVFGDFDGDGDPDLALGAIDGFGVPSDRLLLNDGSGVFSLSPEAFPPRFAGPDSGTVQLRSADVDGDGDLDVLAAVHGSLNGGGGVPIQSTVAEVRLYLNDGQANFTDGSAQINFTAIPGFFPSEFGVIMASLEVVDFNGDGAPDFLSIGIGIESQLYLNDGAGNFSAVVFGEIEHFNLSTARIEGADVDGDGLTDLLALPFAYLQTSGGMLSIIDGTNPDTELLAMSAHVLKSAAGDNPLIVALQFIPLDPVGVPPLVYQMQGGLLVDVTSTVLPDGPNNVHGRGMQVADFDGNGTDDLLIADQGQDVAEAPGAQNHLLTQNLDGTISDSTGNLPVTSHFSHDVAVADIDGDGDIDAYIANIAQEPHLLINDGNGRFTIAN